MNRKIAVVCILVAAIAFVTVCFCVGIGGGKPDPAEPTAVAGDKAKPSSRKSREQRLEARKNKSAKSAADKSADRRARRRATPRIATKDRTDLTPDEKRVMIAIEDALEGENLNALRKVLPEASASANVEIRSDLVDALGWFGKEAMVDLLPFMADTNEDVRSNAVDNWTSALDETSNEQTKAALIESVLEVLRDEDVLDAMMMSLCDMEDLAAIQVIVDVIEGGKASPETIEAAKEQYEFITDEEYTGIEDAEKWLKENADPSEDEEEP